jgi:hypothetical protein
MSREHLNGIIMLEITDRSIILSNGHNYRSVMAGRRYTQEGSSIRWGIRRWKT